MPRRRSFAYLLMIATIVTLPSCVMLLWYQVTRDPNLRPLGVTQEALRAYRGGGETLEIVALVDWVPGSGDAGSRENLADVIQRAFHAKGMDIQVEFRETEGPVSITYRVGSTFVGPFPIAQASSGIAAAVAAFRMY